MDIFWNYTLLKLVYMHGTNKPLGHCIYMQLYIQSLFTVKTTSNCNRYSFFFPFLYVSKQLTAEMNLLCQLA